MSVVLSNTNPVARKDHRCDACEWIINSGWNGMGFSFSELRSIAKAKRNNWKITKGQKYISQSGIHDGEMYRFKAIPEIHEICLKHHLYDE